MRQATCVTRGGRALLIEGPPGVGKSSLALALIDRGALLVGDDGVTLEARDGLLWASPPPNIAGLIEVRNVGLVRLPPTAAPVALILKLDEAAARLPGAIPAEHVCGIAIPALAFYPGGPIPAVRAEWALAVHGLPLVAAKAQD